MGFYSQSSLLVLRLITLSIAEFGENSMIYLPWDDLSIDVVIGNLMSCFDKVKKNMNKQILLEKVTLIAYDPIDKQHNNIIQLKLI